MKKILLVLLCAVMLAGLLAGCGGVDKRLYGAWIDESGYSGFGFGMDGVGYTLFQGFTLPITYAVKGEKIYILYEEEGDALTDPNAMTYGFTFFGDSELCLEYPVDSGDAVSYTRDTSRQQ